MAVQTRRTLKSYFQNGSIPTAQHFAHLIDSMLNKYDDKFHGIWQSGVQYREGDVVIYCRSMFMLVNPKACDTTATPAPKSAETPCPDPNSSFSYCGTTFPNEDNHWVRLEFDFEDKDWKINDKECYIYTYPKVAKKVGIGINDGTVEGDPEPPKAKLHIYEEQRGEFLFNPDGSTDRVEMRMVAFDLPDCKPGSYFSQWFDEHYLHQEIRAGRGFSFDYNNPSTPTPTLPQKLMVVIGENDRPEVGIGTENPTATLHVQTDGTGELQVNPADNAAAPELRLTNLADGQNSASLSVSVNAEFSEFTTDAENGFRFGAKSEPKPSPQSQSKAADSSDATQVVAFSRSGKLGIGTELPVERLHITDGTSGEVQVCLDRPNPSIAILNLEDTSERSTVLAAGVDDTAAILQTDAPCGFVFRQAKEPGLNAKPDLNQGEDLVWIDQHGSVGICKPPLGYQADVHGTVRQYENYLPLNKNTMDDLRPIENALRIVCGLNPVRFVWKNTYDGKLKSGQHFGLQDSNVEKVAIEICKTVTNGAVKEKAVNMLELVPVLIKAIQEQQARIDDLENQLLALRGK